MSSPEVQTLLSLLVVAVALGWLLRSFLGKGRGGSGCSSGECASLSPSIKKLKRRLRAHRH